MKQELFWFVYGCFKLVVTYFANNTSTVSLKVMKLAVGTKMKYSIRI